MMYTAKNSMLFLALVYRAAAFAPADNTGSDADNTEPNAPPSGSGAAPAPDASGRMSYHPQFVVNGYNTVNGYIPERLNNAPGLFDDGAYHSRYNSTERPIWSQWLGGVSNFFGRIGNFRTCRNQINMSRLHSRNHCSFKRAFGWSSATIRKNFPDCQKVSSTCAAQCESRMMHDIRWAKRFRTAEELSTCTFI